jgi:hypothetical protein
MFARWCQENFFKYMLEHYGLDRLIEHGVEPIPETARLVNPAWRNLDGQVRSKAARLSLERAAFGALLLQPEPTTAQTNAFEQQKGKLLRAVESSQQELVELKAARKLTPKHVLFKDLPEQERFSQLKADKKHLLDTIRMVAYRAETIVAGMVRDKLARSDEDARAWVRGLFESSVDLHPDLKNGTLTVAVHRQTTAAQDAVLLHVCNELNETETDYPGTKLRLVFQPAGLGQPPETGLTVVPRPLDCTPPFSGPGQEF